MPPQDFQSDKAMLVISVANRSFTTEFLIEAVSLLLSRHREVTVLIGNELMIYNRFRLPEGGAGAARVLAQYRHDREHQLKKVLLKVNHGGRVKIATYDDFCDAGYARTFRRLMMMVLQDREVMADLTAIAHAYYERPDTPSIDPTEAHPLAPSLLFLIDETAWTMNLAARHGMTDNYYPGDVGKILRAFYCDIHSYDVCAALDLPPHVHRFWRLESEAGGLVPQLMWQAGGDLPVETVGGTPA